MNTQVKSTIATTVTVALFVLGFAVPASAQTVATSALKTTAAEWQAGVRARGGSATVSGIVGDARHAAEGGYHISREDISRAIGGDYSTQRPLDRRGPSNAASAIDMNMNQTWMIRVTRRVLAAARRHDPRLAGVRALNGTVNGSSAIRIEVADGGDVYSATPDHLWHVHVEFFRAYAGNLTVQRRFLAVAFGAPTGPAPRTPGIAEQAALDCPVTHPAVKVLQRALNKIQGAGLPVTGVCSTLTIRQLRLFEKRNHLPNSDRVTRRTWVALSVAYARTASR